jgi:hypothetical protein
MLIIGCSTIKKPVSDGHGSAGKYDFGGSPAAALNKFFKFCEEDIAAAKKVILEKDLIKILSRLQDRDNGGDKYYLLERENITKMIKSVTSDLYNDIVLINKTGTIIYTMNNHNIFAKNVKTSMRSTSLNASYVNRDINPYIGQVSLLPADADRFFITISSKVSGGETAPGIALLKIDIEKLQKIIGDNASIIDSYGVYQVTKDRTKISSPYPDFDALPADLNEEFILTKNGVKSRCVPFNYGNAKWIILINE